MDVNSWRVAFVENDTRFLAVLTCHEIHLAHTFALNFEDPLTFDTPTVGGHTIFKHLSPYQLFVHVGKFLMNSFSPFSARFFVWMIPSFVEHLGLIHE